MTERESRPTVNRAASTKSTPADPPNYKPVSSRQVSWWSVHEYVTRLTEALVDWPAAGTPAWCDLDDGDPLKTAAVADAAQHHALRQEIAQEARAEASKAIAAGADWPSIATQIHQLRNWRSTRPWAIRQAVNDV